ncbi:Uncharacterized protein FWK35_00011073 [Aphis craccivora]|uniref:Uncharacterized protein n=1 Tax=Aphis craccivora TaxID=307492 RepID=A0A6G0YPH3_APHCR|nr:Uncharacterized protein FWK35_00011073 [Aphis craccivora]
MACSNKISIRLNGNKILSNKGVSGKLSSRNRMAKRMPTVSSFKPGDSTTVKFVSSVSKHSKGSNITLSHDKSYHGNCKNSVGTVDQAIRERKIFSAVVKMPDEIQTMLIENGWIGKIKVDDDYFRKSSKYILCILLY